MLSEFREGFSNAYQTIYQKRSVAFDSVATRRFEKSLSYGQTFKRVLPDISNIRIRTNVNGTDNTIDTTADTSETLTVNTDKVANFSIFDTEVVQAGPLQPGEYFGSEIGKKGAIYMDADILYETLNAQQTFDTGDLTTQTSNGTPITLSSTTVPQMVAQAEAKLLAFNQDIEGLVWVVDPYSFSQVHQYILGKEVDAAVAGLRNGYSGGTIGGAQVYISNNLTGTVKITYTGQPSNTETLVLARGGTSITFTAVSSIGSTAGNFLIGGDADTTYTNLTALINAPGTTNANQVALSAANQLVVTDDWQLTATQDTTANTVTIVGKGASKLTATDGLSNATLISYVNSYFGKRGSVDVIQQYVPEMEKKRHPFQPADIVACHWFWGKKTYDDGKRKFLNVQIA